MEQSNKNLRRLKAGVEPGIPTVGMRRIVRRPGAKILQAVALTCIAIACGGCGAAPAGPETVAVTGNVTFEGTPVNGADVAFVPLNAGANAIPAQAVTNDAGAFEVVSVFDQGRTTKTGMLPGEYLVEVTLLQSLPAAPGVMRPPTNSLPTRYASAQSSGLKVVVSPNESNHFPLALTK